MSTTGSPSWRLDGKKKRSREACDDGERKRLDIGREFVEEVLSYGALAATQMDDFVESLNVFAKQRYEVHRITKMKAADMEALFQEAVASGFAGDAVDDLLDEDVLSIGAEMGADHDAVSIDLAPLNDLSEDEIYN